VRWKLTGDDIRKHFKQITRPGSLKGEPEEAERAKIEVMAELAAQLADLNSQMASASKQLSDLNSLLSNALNIALDDFRHALTVALDIFRNEAMKVTGSLRRD